MNHKKATLEAELKNLALVVEYLSDPEYGYQGGPYKDRQIATHAREMLKRLGLA